MWDAGAEIHDRENLKLSARQWMDPNKTTKNDKPPYQHTGKGPCKTEQRDPKNRRRKGTEQVTRKEERGGEEIKDIRGQETRNNGQASTPGGRGATTAHRRNKGAGVRNKGVAGHKAGHEHEQYDWSGTTNPLLKNYMVKLTEPGATKMWDRGFTVGWIPIIADMARRQNNNVKRANMHKLAVTTAEKIRNVIKQGI